MARTPAQKPSHQQPVDVPVSFKTVFWVVVVFTGASLAAAVYLAMHPQQSDTLKTVVDSCNHTWKVGFGGIMGLLAGKRLP